jgi:hypothetical protein
MTPIEPCKCGGEVVWEQHESMFKLLCEKCHKGTKEVPYYRFTETVSQVKEEVIALWNQMVRNDPD